MKGGGEEKVRETEEALQGNGFCLTKLGPHSLAPFTRSPLFQIPDLFFRRECSDDEMIKLNTGKLKDWMDLYKFFNKSIRCLIF